MELLQPWTALLPAATELSVDASDDLQHMNNFFATTFLRYCYN
jgi:hypothetical protein